METAARLRKGLSQQFSPGSARKNERYNLRPQTSLDRRNSINASRFTLGRQSSLDPNHRSSVREELTVPENLDFTMQLLFMSCKGDVKGVEDLLNEGADVNSIDLDGRTALHIAACEGHIEVVKLLLSRKANIDARDRWGSTYYGNIEVYNMLRAKGANVPKSKKTPMAVSSSKEIPEYELNPGELQFRRGEGIAKGTYQVAKWNGTKVAVKILDKESYSDLENINAFKHELTLLEKVRHPNVIQFVGAVTQNIPMMIVSEYHPRGDLHSYLQKKGRLQAHKVLRFALDIARGMNYLHECKPDPIIHCDLKPKNIFLDSGGQLKVAGFGLIQMMTVAPDKAKLVHPEAQIDGSSPYVAPEVFEVEVFDRSVDAFSFGFILHEMIEGAPAFHPKSPEDASKMIRSDGLRPSFKPKSKSCPPDLKELIEECWDPQPLMRPTFSEIITRLDKVHAACTKQGRWKDNFKLPWK
ncbi:unnamed protein product [Spirodela intermedia]|uniref:non-specific serine/threonine protein kinase n=1 Tax=Spirodela intermedia TaxID=51605 RepID=A0A7I8JEC8_SPIIN|nr:unnamed protein product [Spirodela intermedia]CAA6667752.1 unnamed protein product [Spirodela intermedia]